MEAYPKRGWRYEPVTKTIRAVPSNHWIASMDSFDGAEDHEANAAFIVRACNSHDELFTALKNIIEEIGQADYPKHTGLTLVFIDDARAALARAEGKPDA